MEKAPVILIVDDESLVRCYAAMIAAAAGFDVIEASNADEAIRVLEGRDDVRIVFTDINMPGSMDGLKLAHTVRERWPPVALVVTSGYARPAPSQIPTRARFFRKPYVERDVIQAFRELAT